MSRDSDLFLWLVAGVLIGGLVVVLVTPINNANQSSVNSVSKVVVESGFHCLYEPNLLDYSNLSFSGYDYCVHRFFDSEVINGTRYYYLK